jgi:urate oxidase
MTLTWNRYGKSRVRLVKLRKQTDPHELVDLTLDVQLEGTFEEVYVSGDNRSCLATDTMKNVVYALARQDPIAHVESFAERLAEHFAAKPAVSRVRISAVEHRWERITVAGLAHPHAFTQPGDEHWTAVVTRDAQGVDVTSGLANLVVLKTTDSAFSGFPRDRYTTLADTEDRILATSVTAAWKYRRGTRDFGGRVRIRRRLIETFAEHDSRSVQHTLYAMAEGVLDACGDVSEVTLTISRRSVSTTRAKSSLRPTSRSG